MGDSSGASNYWPFCSIFRLKEELKMFIALGKLILVLIGFALLASGLKDIFKNS